MAADKKQKPSSIPIRFLDPNDQTSEGAPSYDDQDSSGAVDHEVYEINGSSEDADFADSGVNVETSQAAESGFGGPELAELVASRAELKRLENALAEARDIAARKQADFENYRKRIERDRASTHNKIVADVAGKLLPVVDNLGRALDAERTVEASESKEFRHFLHGVELIAKQLNDVLDSLGIKAIPSVGERFDPHIHEAVVTEPSDEFEPDTVSGEITRGYRIGDRLLRPALVKVAARRND
jgi:molecular chaperone GrpE